ncbi:Nif3-like dinuclear metal center hexameric protein [Lyngbya confervoides]|uniref:GTP cyclohydrolase 1 type 2 homolog n=1 Tax=Lyngbya confervoides BDU141951 TaxID=1574623 RepID=A0ABD4T7X3_9CYAN|nr:Nif3-like dinuclear metal center hexameric protein [Lyngbya confervoides]MCM1984614.1 Nif3-like dinuclear metal center hexameric protein [Lyngbya confervoides BDU141951]
MSIQALIARFETWANPQWQESWDNCGWQIQPDILAAPPRILVCLTPTLAVMAEAIALKAQGIPINLIFAHHPLIFGGVSSLRMDDPIGKMAHLAYGHNIGLYSAHTNFDQVADGTADVLAQLLNLQQVTPIQETQAGLGYGRVGQLPQTMTLARLLTLIDEKLTPPRLIYSPYENLEQSIDRVAVLGGSGASYIAAVVQTGAQVYLTSDCKFHQFQESRDRNLVLVDAGHYATERPACAKLCDRLLELGAQLTRLSRNDEDFRQFF